MEPDGRDGHVEAMQSFRAARSVLLGAYGDTPIVKRSSFESDLEKWLTGNTDQVCLLRLNESTVDGCRRTPRFLDDGLVRTQPFSMEFVCAARPD